MRFDYDKFASSVLYFLEHAEWVGVTKLVKLLYFLDFDFFESNDRAVTGARYVAIDQGPVPDGFNKLLEAMEQDGWIKPYTGHSGPYRMRCFRPLVGHNPDDFDEDELDAVRLTSRRWKHNRASDLVAAAHEDPPWLLVWREGRGRGQPIPYELVRRRGEPLQELEAEARRPMTIRDVYRLWRRNDV